MLHGSVPRSISRSLAGSPIDPNYAPDGLTEQAIDDLLDELGYRIALTDAPIRPVRLLASVTEMRGTRRRTRRNSATTLLLAADTEVAGEVA